MESPETLILYRVLPKQWNDSPRLIRSKRIAKIKGEYDPGPYRVTNTNRDQKGEGGSAKQAPEPLSEA
jgi:hypothetical protein